MYYPYFRGKQYELITIRESASLLGNSGFIPIIEPVRQSGVLEKTLIQLSAEGASSIVIVNPFHGDLSNDCTPISNLFTVDSIDRSKVQAGILLKESTTIREIVDCCNRYREQSLALIHAGFADARGLQGAMGNDLSGMTQIFLEEHCGRLYRRHFEQCSTRVLIRDGFRRRNNRDYPAEEFFSDLHATFRDDGMQGFGDFLIVGDDYSESGGPAYAVAIHLTYINELKDRQMHIYHFKSDRQNTPTDPAGKFREALTKLMQALAAGDSQLIESESILEFQDLSERGHFPGLGYVKKLSMKHHIETLSAYIEQQNL